MASTPSTSTKRDAEKDARKDARAKGAKSKAKGQKAPKPKKKPAERKPGELSRVQKIVIVAFVVIFALSTLAGALASVFQSHQAAQDSAQDSADDTDAIARIDGNYEGIVSSFEAKVAENPDDAASLLALGRYCLAWGANVRSQATTDDETSHANELFERAMGYYDQYLAIEDSPAARVDRALCQYYEGDTSAAVTALEELTQSSPDYAPAWLNLGMLYETQGNTDAATSAYEQAQTLDPNNEYGAYSYATQRLSALQSADEDDSADSGDGSTDDSADAADTGDADGASDGSGAVDSSTGDLSSDLTDATGTGL